MFNLPENPRRTHGRATDHDASNFRFRAPARDFLGRKQIPIANNRDRDRLGYFADDAPVCFAGITLSAGASRHSQGGNAALLQNSSDAHGIDRSGMPTNPKLAADPHGD